MLFRSFTLMSIATLGAFYIGEYPEGVAVMLFYSLGELFQDKAVDKAKRNISALLDVRPETATVIRNGSTLVEAPQRVQVGETIEVKAGAAGKVFKIEANVGQAVKKGDAVVIIEAMKMEIPVVAPEDGTVASIDVAVGAAVENGDVLATMN